MDVESKDANKNDADDNVQRTPTYPAGEQPMDVDTVAVSTDTLHPDIGRMPSFQQTRAEAAPLENDSNILSEGAQASVLTCIHICFYSNLRATYTGQIPGNSIGKRGEIPCVWYAIHGH